MFNNSVIHNGWLDTQTPNPQTRKPQFIKHVLLFRNSTMKYIKTIEIKSAKILLLPIKCEIIFVKKKLSLLISLFKFLYELC